VPNSEKVAVYALRLFYVKALEAQEKLIQKKGPASKRIPEPKKN
jgi:hypothetical protein